jgi:FdhD protein
VITRPTGKTRAEAWTLDTGSGHPSTPHRRVDLVATEAPLEIQLATARTERRPVAITMRTPGADTELAVGFLHGEGVITRLDQIHRVMPCTDGRVPAEHQRNVVTVELHGHHVELPDRRLLTTSACGVCSATSLESLRLREHRVDGYRLESATATIPPQVIADLPARLTSQQRLFTATGGVHAAGLFTPTGKTVCVREDIGRHNAVDKVIGWALLQGQLPLHDHLLLVSSRASYEIMQKALAAGISTVCAVSAPSSLAIDIAVEFGMTLVGFVRGTRFTVYAGHWRIWPAEPSLGARP